MKFHEDIIFKSEGQKYGQELIEIINITGKIIKVQPTEYSKVEPKIYKPDLVFELEDKVINLEFQSTKINSEDKRRFLLYTTLIDSEIIKSTKPIETHVLSTIEKEKTKVYKINSDSRFSIYIHSLKTYDADEFLNKMKTKIKNDEEFNKKELLMLSLLCFMQTNNNIEQTLLDSAETIINIKCLNNEIAQFVKGIVLILSDKFVENELTNTRISNLMGGNMKIVEDYAERYAERYAEKKLNENDKKWITLLYKQGFSLEDIAEMADINLDFVKQTLSK